MAPSGLQGTVLCRPKMVTSGRFFSDASNIYVLQATKFSRLPVGRSTATAFMTPIFLNAGQPFISLTASAHRVRCQLVRKSRLNWAYSQTLSSRGLGRNQLRTGQWAVPVGNPALKKKRKTDGRLHFLTQRNTRHRRGTCLSGCAWRRMLNSRKWLPDSHSRCGMFEGRVVSIFVASK